MIAFSFLGLGQYNKDTQNYSYTTTKYKFNDKSFETDQFAHAVFEFIEPDKLFLIMTEKAKQYHSENIKGLFPFEEIIIPDGKSEDEFWIIFDKITSVIKNEDEVVFDITHGFRSQPFLVVVLLIYLKTVRNIKIKNILYGAYDARDENNNTPVFELKPFMELIEWSNAAREFITNGNMKHFQYILSKIHKTTHINKYENPSRQLMGAGKDLEKLTDAMDTIRVNEIFEYSSSFEKRLKDLLVDIENHSNTKPFKEILEKIVEKISPITNADKNIFSSRGFDAQKAIIKWYIETNKYQKAITLIREYIVSKYLFEIENVRNIVDRSKRESIENKLGELLNYLKNGKRISGRKGEYADIWQKITTVRNDINHASMNKDPKSGSTIIDKTTEVSKLLVEKF